MLSHGTPFWASDTRVINFVSPISYSARTFEIDELNSRIIVIARQGHLYVYDLDTYAHINTYPKPENFSVLGTNQNYYSDIDSVTNKIIYVDNVGITLTNRYCIIRDLNDLGNYTAIDINDYGLSGVSHMSVNNGVLWVADYDGFNGNIAKISLSDLNLIQLINVNGISGLYVVGDKIFTTYRSGNGQVTTFECRDENLNIIHQYPFTPATIAPIFSKLSDYLIVNKTGDIGNYILCSLSQIGVAYDGAIAGNFINNGYCYRQSQDGRVFFLHGAYVSGGEGSNRGLYTTRLTTTRRNTVSHHNPALGYDNSAIVNTTKVVMDVAFDYDNEMEYYLCRDAATNQLRIEKRDMATHTLIEFEDIPLYGNANSKIFFYKGFLYVGTINNLYRLNNYNIVYTISLGAAYLLTSIKSFEEDKLIVCSQTGDPIYVIDLNTLTRGVFSNVSYPDIELYHNYYAVTRGVTNSSLRLLNRITLRLKKNIRHTVNRVSADVSADLETT